MKRSICPKCGCKRFRILGSFGPVNPRKKSDVLVCVECMRCEHAWIR